MKIDYFKVRNMSILNLVTNKILNAKYFSTYSMLKSKEIDDIFIQFHYFLTWDPQHNTKITNIAMVAVGWLTKVLHAPLTAASLPLPRMQISGRDWAIPSHLALKPGNHGGRGFYMFIFFLGYKCL